MPEIFGNNINTPNTSNIEWTGKDQNSKSEYWQKIHNDNQDKLNNLRHNVESAPTENEYEFKKGDTLSAVLRDNFNIQGKHLLLCLTHLCLEENVDIDTFEVGEKITINKEDNQYKIDIKGKEYNIFPGFYYNESEAETETPTEPKTVPEAVNPEPKSESVEVELTLEQISTLQSKLSSCINKVVEIARNTNIGSDGAGEIARAIFIREGKNQASLNIDQDLVDSLFNVINTKVAPQLPKGLKADFEQSKELLGQANEQLQKTLYLSVWLQKFPKEHQSIGLSMISEIIQNSNKTYEEIQKIAEENSALVGYEKDSKTNQYFYTISEGFGDLAAIEQGQTQVAPTMANTSEIISTFFTSNQAQMQELGQETISLLKAKKSLEAIRSIIESMKAVDGVDPDLVDEYLEKITKNDNEDQIKMMQNTEEIDINKLKSSEKTISADLEILKTENLVDFLNNSANPNFALSALIKLNGKDARSIIQNLGQDAHFFSFREITFGDKYIFKFTEAFNIQDDVYTVDTEAPLNLSASLSRQIRSRYLTKAEINQLPERGAPIIEALYEMSEYEAIISRRVYNEIAKIRKAYPDQMINIGYNSNFNSITITDPENPDQNIPIRIDRPQKITNIEQFIDHLRGMHSSLLSPTN
ncbi:MAG: hypothetical protein N4A36_03715 [Candidatus Gracilibacteria bacterium]|jgi:hypothetical protein|nr:hypothetical protein [Candidatus Gracilibacteria bacterium]